MMDAAAAACTGHLMVVVLLHMAETTEHYKGRRLHVAEGGGGVAAVDGCSGSSQHCS